MADELCVNDHVERVRAVTGALVTRQAPPPPGGALNTAHLLRSAAVAFRRAADELDAAAGFLARGAAAGAPETAEACTAAAVTLLGRFGSVLFGAAQPPPPAPAPGGADPLQN